MADTEKKNRNIFSVIFKILSIIIAVFLLLLAVCAGVIFYLNSPVKNADGITLTEADAIRLNEDGSYQIDVRRGESSQSVGLRLERAGLIRSRYTWDLIGRLEKEHIKTGIYDIPVPSSPLSIYRILVAGREILLRVTIPEGVTLNKMALILEEAGICPADDFLEAARNPGLISQYNIPGKSMEGYLFPDTYLISAGFPAEKVIRTLADNFFSRLEKLYPDIYSLSPEELNKKVILASIIEREYRVAQEAPVMAGVFINRLRINMALQSCATVEYIITEIQGKPHPGRIYFSDLEIVNPYNTYMYPGLPPGPISAPGIVALSAALNPQDTEYLFFRLTDPASGRHYFSSTYDDHIMAGELIPKGQY